MNDKASVQELYGVAVTARDLRFSLDHRTLLDFIVAAGMAGVRDPLATTWLRWLYGEDAHEWRSAYEGVYAWASREAAKRQWDGAHLRRVILTVMWWYKHGICPECHGTKMEAVPGTPVLSDEPCKTCHGEGRLSLDRLLLPYGADWIKRGKDIRDYLDQLTERPVRDILRRIR